MDSVVAAVTVWESEWMPLMESIVPVMCYIIMITLACRVIWGLFLRAGGGGGGDD